MVFPKEPAVWIGLIAATLALLVGFGLKISGVQIDLIMLFVTAALPIATAIATRKQVYSPATVEIIKEVALAAPKNTTPEHLEVLIVEKQEELAETKV